MHNPVQYLQKLLEKASAHQKKEKLSDILLKVSGTAVQNQQKPLANSQQQLGSVEAPDNKPLTNGPVTANKQIVPASPVQPKQQASSNAASTPIANNARTRQGGTISGGGNDNRVTPYSTGEIGAGANRAAAPTQPGAAGVVDFTQNSQTRGNQPLQLNQQTPASSNVLTPSLPNTQFALKSMGRVANTAGAMYDMAHGNYLEGLKAIAKKELPVVNFGSHIAGIADRAFNKDIPGAVLEGAATVVPVVPDAIQWARDNMRNVNIQAEKNNRMNLRNREVRGSLKEARYTGIVDKDGNSYVNNDDTLLLGKLGFSVTNYSNLEKTSEVLDLYSYIEKYAGVPKAVSKAVDKGEAFSGSFLKDMGYSVPKGYEIKGDLCYPVEKKAEEPLAPNMFRLSNGEAVDLDRISWNFRGPLRTIDYDEYYIPKQFSSTLSAQADSYAPGAHYTAKGPKGENIPFFQSSTHDGTIFETVPGSGRTKHTIKYFYDPTKPKPNLPENLAEEIVNAFGRDKHEAILRGALNPSGRNVDEILEKLKKELAEEAVRLGPDSGVARRLKHLNIHDAVDESVKQSITAGIKNRFREMGANVDAPPHPNPIRPYYSFTEEAKKLHKSVNAPKTSLLQNLKPYRKAIGIGAGVTGLAALAYHLHKRKQEQSAIQSPIIEKESSEKTAMTPEQLLYKSLVRANNRHARSLRGGIGAIAGATVGGLSGLIFPGDKTDASSGETDVNNRFEVARNRALVGAGIGGGLGFLKGHIAREKFINSSLKNQTAEDIKTFISGRNHNPPRPIDDKISNKLNDIYNRLLGDKTASGRCWEGYEPVPGKEPYSNDSCRPKTEKKKPKLKKEAGATPERIRELILQAAKGCKDSSASLSRMSASRVGRPRAPRSAAVKQIASSVDLPAANAQGMLPFAASHEFEVLKHNLDPSYALNSDKYLGKQSELEKEATTISALKSIIRTLRARGITVTKDPVEYSKKIFNRLSKEHPGVFNNISDLTSQIENMPPSFNPLDKVVYVPKRLPESLVNQSRGTQILKKKYRMSDAIMHEGAGHAMHYLDDPHPLHTKITQNPHLFPSESLALERIANNNAINHMRASAVPEHMIDNYKQNFAKPGFGIYRKHMGWNSASKRSPAYSVENPSVTHPGQIDKLYKPMQEIADEAMKRYMSKSSEEQNLIDEAKLKRRFKYWAKKMREHGVMAGTYHKRIAIPKHRLPKEHLEQLGFEPVAIAIPEAGQDEFASYRNPNNLFHLHSHGDHWTMHEDEHPSLTMALRNAPIEKVPEAVVSGLSHIATEGIPGAYKYISHRITGSGNMLDAVMNESKQKKNSIGQPIQG